MFIITLTMSSFYVHTHNQAMIKLHQLNVFGSVLIVVYASPQSEREAPIENR